MPPLAFALGCWEGSASAAVGVVRGICCDENDVEEEGSSVIVTAADRLCVGVPQQGGWERWVEREVRPRGAGDPGQERVSERCQAQILVMVTLKRTAPRRAPGPALDRLWLSSCSSSSTDLHLLNSRPSKTTNQPTALAHANSGTAHCDSRPSRAGVKPGSQRAHATPHGQPPHKTGSDSKAEAVTKSRSVFHSSSSIHYVAT